MTKVIIYALFITLFLSCSNNVVPDEIPEETNLAYGGDFSIIKKLEDYGAVCKVNGVAMKGLQIF